MGLYLKSGYIDQDKIIDRNDVFIFEIGPRGTGKSYGILKYIIENKIKFLLKANIDCRSCEFVKAGIFGK